MAARLPDSLPPADLSVVLTPMARRHLREVLRIEQQVYPRPWSLGLFMSELALADSRLYAVATIDGAVIGYAGLLLAVDEAHVTTIAIDPRWHRRGIATRLLLLLARRAIARGAEHLTLEVRMSNTAAQELYRRFGFAPAGVRKNYYVETGEDALIMWVHDIRSPAYADRLAGIEAGLAGSTLVAGFDQPQGSRR